MGKHNSLFDTTKFPGASYSNKMKARVWQCGLCGLKKEYEDMMPLPGACDCGSSFWERIH